MTNLTGKQIEEAFEFFHSELIEDGLELVNNEPNFDHGLHTHLTFKDKTNYRVLLEIKQSTITRRDIEHLLVNNVKFRLIKTRIILAAPFIPQTTRTSLEKNGIEYIQFSKTKIAELYDELEKNTSPKTSSSAHTQDGNVAFKVAYNKEDWSHVFSEELDAYNFKHKTWRKEQATDEEISNNPIGKDYVDQKINEDASAQKDIAFNESEFHEDELDNDAMTSLYAKLGKMAVFTSLAPEKHESERFIFAIGQMNYFEPSTEENQEDFDGFHCDKDTALIFKTNRPKFWKYYSNTNNPDLIAWNTGLFRYLDDDVVLRLLKDISETNVYPNTFKEKAKHLLEQL